MEDKTIWRLCKTSCPLVGYPMLEPQDLGVAPVKSG
jgi:hypothetical protein